MLHTAAVYPRTLEILNAIMQRAELKPFNLVGGTALALQIGHRISVDLDLFTHEAYNDQIVIDNVQAIVNEVEIIMNAPPYFTVGCGWSQIRFSEISLSVYSILSGS